MIYTKILMLLFSVVFTNCGSNTNDIEMENINSKSVIQDKMNYKNTIDTIDLKVVDLTSISDLLAIEDFIKIYEQANLYTQDAIVFISDSANSLQKKQIAVYSMQNLSDSLYIEFCTTLLDLYEKSVVGSDLLEAAFFYSLNKKYQIIRNYHSPAVIRLLQSFSTKSNNNEIKQRIETILSGKTWGKLDEFLNNGN